MGRVPAVCVGAPLCFYGGAYRRVKGLCISRLINESSWNPQSGAQDGKYEATWKREFKLPLRKAGMLKSS